jgi:hypothetical protein
MAFSAATFIVATSPSDKVIRFQTIDSQIVGGMNVCVFDSLAFAENEMWVQFDGGDKIILTFSSATEVSTAAANLRAIIDSLYVNCAVTIPGPPTSPVVVSKTLAQFNIDRTGSALAPNTVYEINDLVNTFNLPVSGIFHVIVDKPDSRILRGVNIVTNSFVEMDFVLNKIVHLYDTVNDVEIRGDAAQYVPTGVVQHIIGRNSTIIADTVTKAKVENSIIYISNSSAVEIHECPGITLNNVTNSYFYGITGNYSALVLDKVRVDVRGRQSGKTGKEIISSTDMEIIYAFERYGRLVVPTLITSITKVLDSHFTTVETMFEFVVPAAGIGAGIDITVKDSAGAILTIINDKHAGKAPVKFIYNITSSKYELFEEVVEEHRTVVTVSSNGQTSFSNILPYNIIDVSRTDLYVNARKQFYGVDYTITGRTITWISTDFPLETTDYIEILHRK